MTTNIKTYYTGGNITIAESSLTGNQYAVVSSDALDFLTIYAYSEGETTYLPEDMISSIHKIEMPSKMKPMYNAMVKELQLS